MDKPQDKVTATFIFEKMQEFVEAKMPVKREAWLEVAFKLEVLRLDEAKLFNQMSRAVAQKKLDLFKAQEKRNVSAVDIEVEASEEYQMMKDQEALLYSIDELVRVGKKNADMNF